MSNHNPAPWRYSSNRYMAAVLCDTEIPEIRGANDVESYGGHLICESVAIRNAQRIVACVNACEGVSNEDLIDGASVKEIISQRDELLDALKTIGVHTITDEDGDEVEVLFGSMRKIKDAIDKFKGDAA
ncbi:MAG: hypothetical protein ACRC8W_19340 [Plesiomonas shigelloides]